MFKVVLKETGALLMVYRARSSRQGIWFLVYDGKDWTWLDAQMTRPVEECDWLVRGTIDDNGIIHNYDEPQKMKEPNILRPDFDELFGALTP